MRERFLDFIKKHALIEPNDRVLLAVSGGVDSMCLLELFHRSGLSFAVAHCNFSLRGAESDADEALVRQRAAELNIPFFTKRFDTQIYAEEHQASIQMAARALRYDWFAALCREGGFDKIATAHHLDDSLETVIHNLARGTSIAGLRGIKPLTNRLIRPLLDFTKQEIVAWATEQGLEWREDASNAEVYYKRNFIRQQIVEPLKEVNPDLLNTFRLTAERNREVEEVFLREVERLNNEIVHAEGGLLKIRKADVPGPYVLEHLLRPYGFNYHQAVEIMEAFQAISGKQFVTSSHCLVVDREFLILSRNDVQSVAEQLINDSDTEVIIGDKSFEVRKVEATGIDPKWKQEQNALLDMGKLHFPLKLRGWQEGDAFYPLGMRGKKKLSDFMIDRKIPVNLKNHVRVVESAGEIVWVAGMRIDDRFKMTAWTGTVFCLIEKIAHV